MPANHSTPPTITEDYTSLYIVPLFWEISESLLFKEERVCQSCSFVFGVMLKTISGAFRG